MSNFGSSGVAGVATILLAGCSPAVAVAASLSCALSSGQRLVTTRDLSALFPGAVVSCQDAAESAAPAAPRLAGKMPRLVWSAAGLAGGGQAAVAMDALDAPPAIERKPPNDEAPPRPLAARIPPEGLSALIADAAGRHGVDPHLVRAIVQVESAFRPAAVSNKGAVGLMQIMPATGARYGVSQRHHLFDPATNIDAGTRYLRDLIAMFPGRKDLVIAAYNAGEGAVIKYGRAIPPYRETRSYVRMVMQVYESIVGSKAGAALNALRGVSTDANQIAR
jgi:soluble lytic murein transglycosylase-like protein